MENNAANNAANTANPTGFSVSTGDPELDKALQTLLDPLDIGQAILEARGLEVSQHWYGYNSCAITVKTSEGETLLKYSIGD